MNILVLIVIIFCCGLSRSDDELLFSNNNISSVLNTLRYLKKHARTWKPGITPISLLSRSELSSRMGIIMTPELLSKLNRKKDGISDIVTGAGGTIPEKYDLRKEYPQCTSLRTIKDQGPCGSCWAVTSASVLTDRLCISTNGTTSMEMSAQDILTCCYSCKPVMKDGCEGGFIEYAIRFSIRYGISTGAGYGSKEGCKPYAVAPCTKRPCVRATAGGCQRFCTNEKYDKSYRTYVSDKKKEKTSYRYLLTDLDIKRAILEKGPVYFVMTVYDDFAYYSSGIYHHEEGSGKKLENHVLRLLGWGIEKDMQYWIAANSWGTKWGENGFCKLRYGVKETKGDKTIAIG